MQLTEKDVEHVAALARLHVTEEQKRVLAIELGQILAYAQELQSLDLTDIPPTTQASAGSKTVTRADRPRASLPQALALANAPDEDEGQFRVPAVLEG
ncbi:MAG: Asp-tRNA(Asn)/Glu-tRNA(Gln) amidotransferase subunit GatC [Firmicutes bacterium]|nr:Asp-tRNA(Asn)/Glu-tRNA(Gln) amidotransferase subunit GatC [Bacillota bacterium]